MTEDAMVCLQQRVDQFNALSKSDERDTLILTDVDDIAANDGYARVLVDNLDCYISWFRTGQRSTIVRLELAERKLLTFHPAKRKDDVM